MQDLEFAVKHYIDGRRRELANAIASGIASRRDFNINTAGERLANAIVLFATQLAVTELRMPCPPFDPAEAAETAVRFHWLKENKNADDPKEDGPTPEREQAGEGEGEGDEAQETDQETQ